MEVAGRLPIFCAHRLPLEISPSSKLKNQALRCSGLRHIEVTMFTVRLMNLEELLRRCWTSDSNCRLLCRY